MRKIVLTGGPYAGKSTVAERLRAEGFALAPEAALLVIGALREELGIERAQGWRDAHPGPFQERIAQLQLDLEARAERSGSEWIVCDRGIPDGIAYCRLRGIEPPALVLEAAARARYDAVLLFDTLGSFDSRSESGRVDDRGDSLRLRELIRTVYLEHADRPVVIPERPLGERLALVRAVLEGLGRPPEH